MNKQSTLNNENNENSERKLPKLRFPEFQAALGWEISPLNTLAKRVVAKNKAETISRVLTNSANDGIVDQQDYFDREIANKDNLGGYYIVEMGDYVYNPRVSIVAPVGPISKNKIGQGVMSPLYTVFRFHYIHNEFYEHYFKTPLWHKYLYQVSNSGARHDRMNVSNDDFMAMPVPILSLEEQQKIADCLSSLDELIALQEQKLDALKNHKKSLMQQLFPSHNDLQASKQAIVYPKLRFSQFKNDGGWKIMRLGDLFERITTKNRQNNKNVLTISAQYGLIGQLDFFNKSVSSNNLENYYLLEKGDFAYNKSYSNGYPVGAIKPLKLYDNGVVSSLYICFKLKSEYQAYNEFFEHYFEFGLQNNEIANIAQEGARNHGLLNIAIQDFFDKVSICYPEKQEQQKISDCLSSMDNLIDEQTQKLGSLKKHKKGLMQQLFIEVS